MSQHSKGKVEFLFQSPTCPLADTIFFSKLVDATDTISEDLQLLEDAPEEEIRRLAAYFRLNPASLLENIWAGDEDKVHVARK